MENAPIMERFPAWTQDVMKGGLATMMVFYLNALSDSMVTFLLYVLSLLAVLSTYKLIPRRIKKFVLDSLSFASEGVPTPHV